MREKERKRGMRGRAKSERKKGSNKTRREREKSVRQLVNYSLVQDS